MKSTLRIATMAAMLTLPLPAMADPIQAVMYKNPTCSCCETYAAYLEKTGLFKIELKPTNDVSLVSSGLGVPEQLQGCHSLVIGKYVVEGFVPVEVVKKMLIELPRITGISLPGMPMGSAGMPGTKTEPFTIYAFTKDDKPPTVYAVD